MATICGVDLVPTKEYMFHIDIGEIERVDFIQGDITKIPADAIVNAANSELIPGGGVDGAIHHAGGPAIAKECAEIRRTKGRLEPGHAIHTTAGKLEAKAVIHTVGPVWHGGRQNEPETLANCYLSGCELADSLGYGNVLFPAISTGVYGYPVSEAAKVAIPVLIAAVKNAKRLCHAAVVLYDFASFEAFVVEARDIAEGRHLMYGLGVY